MWDSAQGTDERANARFRIPYQQIADHGDAVSTAVDYRRRMLQRDASDRHERQARALGDRRRATDGVEADRLISGVFGARAEDGTNSDVRYGLSDRQRELRVGMRGQSNDGV